MKFYLIKYTKIIIFLTIFIILAKCAGSKDPVTGEKQVIEPNLEKRAKEYAEKGGGIMNILGKSNENTNFKFSTSNVLWRATLKSLDFLPLINADYTGGIIIYDWYSQTNSSKEQIKISVQFLSDELRSDSIKITAHKKICDNSYGDRCSNSTVDQNFANSIKESIIITARTLKIEEAKKEKK
jgi:hypothetical protein